MKNQDQVQATKKGTSGPRKAITLFIVAVLGIAVGIFFGHFYFVHELVLFVAIAALLAVFAANLLVLGILFRAAGQSILLAVRKAKPRVAAQEETNSERQVGPILGSPTISTGAGTDAH
ncbi:MAG: hypothetical protein WBR26_22670 [Candidatus Acidiferrum sp.]